MGRQILEPQILDEVKEYCDYFIEPLLGQPMDLSGLKLATNNIISELVFGGRSRYDDSKFKTMIDYLDELVAASARASLTQNVPLLRSSRFSGESKMQVADQFLVREMQERLRQSKASLNRENPTNIFDHFLLNQTDADAQVGAFRGTI